MPGGGDPTKTTAKYIYVYRNPKDAAVSMYYHAKTLHSQEFPWDLFFEMYCMQGKVPYAHVVDHVVEWWKHKGINVETVVEIQGVKGSPTFKTGEGGQLGLPTFKNNNH